MKTALASIALLLSVSVSAAADSASIKLESKAKSSVSKVKSAPKSFTEKSAKGIKVTRRSTEKVKRAESLKTQEKGLQKAPTKNREANPEKSANSHAFSIYDAWATLEYDFDGDGFFSEFTVSFDVDFAGGYADVYADMYLSKDGGPWIYFNTTDIFTIYGSDSDPYSVTTFLNYDFPTGYYDVVIDVYEAGYPGIVASVGPLDFYDLQSLPLEDNEHELDSNRTQITYVASEMSDDLDRDGFFTILGLEYDVDTLDMGRLVYTEIQLTNVDTFERITTATEDFQIANGTEFVELLLEEGYEAGWYDVEIRVIDSLTGQVLANAAQDFSSLIQLPLESIDYDSLPDNPQVNQGTVVIEDAVIVHESGGGSLYWMLLLLGLMIPFRMKSQLSKKV